LRRAKSRKSFCETKATRTQKHSRAEFQASEPEVAVILARVV
jgi:hypothetical protein